MSLESDISDALDRAYRAGYNDAPIKDPILTAHDIVEAHRFHEQKLVQDCVPEKSPEPIGTDVWLLLEAYRVTENDADLRTRLASKIIEVLGL